MTLRLHKHSMTAKPDGLMSSSEGATARGRTVAYRAQHQRHHLIHAAQLQCRVSFSS